MSRVDHVMGVKAWQEVSITAEPVGWRQPASAMQIADVAASFKSFVDLGMGGLQVLGGEVGLGGGDCTTLGEQRRDGEEEFDHSADEGQPVHGESLGAALRRAK